MFDITDKFCHVNLIVDVVIIRDLICADTHLVFLVDIHICLLIVFALFMPQVRTYFTLNLDDIIMYYVYNLSYSLTSISPLNLIFALLIPITDL